MIDEFDYWFNSEMTLPIDGERVWARTATGCDGGTIWPAIFVVGPDRGWVRFVVEGDAGEKDMWGQVFWQPRTTILI